MDSEHQVRSKSHGRSGFAVSPLLLLGIVVLAVVVFIVVFDRQSTDGPMPVVWDKTPCALCAMHLGDPRFAAQLTIASGTTYFYDDPGCLFLHQRQLEATDTAIHARWFRELKRDNWLNAEAVAFQRCENSPMDYGFGAVPPGSPAAVSLKDAAAEVLAK